MGGAAIAAIVLGIIIIIIGTGVSLVACYLYRQNRRKAVETSGNAFTNVGYINTETPIPMAVAATPAIGNNYDSLVKQKEAFQNDNNEFVKGFQNV